MRNMDLRCDGCGYVVIDYLERDGSPTRPLECPTCKTNTLDRVLLGGQSAHVHGDECDVVVKHGICNEDGSPRRYRSKSEMARAARELGERTGTHVYNKVQHIGDRGSDRNKNTQRFV